MSYLSTGLNAPTFSSTKEQREKVAEAIVEKSGGSSWDSIWSTEWFTDKSNDEIYIPGQNDQPDPQKQKQKGISPAILVGGGILLALVMFK